MPPDQLAVQMPQHIDDREVAGLVPHLRVEQHLQQQVAQFLRQVRPVLALDRVQYLVGFLQRVPADGGKALLAVPRASARRAQPRHDRHALPKECSGECTGVSGWADFLLAHASTLTEVLTRRSAGPKVDRVTIPRRSVRLAILPSEPIVRFLRSFRRNADHPDCLRVALRPGLRQLSERLHQPPAAPSFRRAAGVALPSMQDGR